MKFSFIIPIVFSILLGWLFGNFIYKEYSDVSRDYRNSQTYYLLQQGVYSNQNVYKKNISNLDSYTTIENDNKYYVYVGMTTSYKQAQKIKDIYKQKGIDLYIKEDKTNNKYFLNDVKQYETLLNDCNDFTKINRVLKVIVASYEENLLES